MGQLLDSWSVLTNRTAKTNDTDPKHQTAAIAQAARVLSPFLTVAEGTGRMFGSGHENCRAIDAHKAERVLLVRSSMATGVGLPSTTRRPPSKFALTFIGASFGDIPARRR